MVNKHTNAPLHYTHAEWKSLIADWEQSGISWNAYCKKLSSTLPNLPSKPMQEEEKINPLIASQGLFNAMALTPPESNSSDIHIELALSQGHQLILEGVPDLMKVLSLLTTILKIKR